MREITPPAVVVQAERSLEDIARAIKSKLRRSLTDARDIGLDLIEAKRLCGHGNFLPYLRDQVGISARSADNYRLIADRWGELSKFANIANLGIVEAIEHLNQQDAAEYMSQRGDRREQINNDAQDHEAWEHAEPTSPTSQPDQIEADASQEEEVAQPSSPPESTLFPLPTTPPRGGRIGSTGDFITLEAWEGMSARDRREALASKASGKRFNDQGSSEGIEWALWSWNPVTGCRHNCPYCYARDIANRFYEPKFEPTLWPARLSAPANTPFPTAKASEWMGHKNVFTCSMADLFGRWVPKEWIEAVLSAVRASPQWNFLFLTKFPQRMAEFRFPGNAWVGTTVDCQARVANAEKAFRKIEACVKWLSCEPLIEPLTFTDLGAFDWVVLGGASSSSQTPEWHPPRSWINAIEAEAERLGVRVYEKANLLSRTREYPGIEPQIKVEAPESLRYLPDAKAG